MNLIEARIPDDWTDRLADVIAAAVREFAPRLDGEAVTLFAADCHPWHGSIGLSVLTDREVAADGTLADPAEMASWRHFDFTRDLEPWQPAGDLGRLMQAVYEAGDRPQVAEAFLRATATAATSRQVVEAVAPLARTDGFRVSVTHPDDGREFAPAEQSWHS